ncbi:MAG: sigma-70 family RNA polymerase sigma factor [bacterium]|nr:sigma-70 family RNA polymerase sigma factor [bacterium]
MSNLPARQQQGRSAGDLGDGCKPAPSAADRQWWTETVESSVAPVYRFIRARVPAEAVDDLVQETFVSAAGSVSQFDAQIATVWTWLLGIARKRIADYYRASGRDPLLNIATGRFASDLADIEGALACGTPLPDEVCESEELRLVVRAALTSIEPKHQACLIARYYKDLSLDEVGQLMNLSRSATNSLLHRARVRLRRTVERLIGEGTDFEDFAK